MENTLSLSKSRPAWKTRVKNIFYNLPDQIGFLAEPGTNFGREVKRLACRLKQNGKEGELAVQLGDFVVVVVLKEASLKVFHKALAHIQLQ